MDYGRKIKELRESVLLSQDELALALGTNRKYIEKIESGRIKPTLDVIELICQKFNIPLAEFFGGQQAKEIVVEKEIEVIKEVEKEIAVEKEIIIEKEVVKEVFSGDGLEKILSYAEYKCEYYSNYYDEEEDKDYKEFKVYYKGICVAYFDLIMKIKEMTGK